MIHFKHILIGSVAALTLIGCGETANMQNNLELKEALAPRMVDLGLSLSNEEIVNQDYQALSLPKYIHQDFILPMEGITGSDINWTLLNSGDFNITNHTLMITDTTKKQYAKLSAFINYDLNTSTPEANKTKAFCLTILPKANTEMEKATQDIEMVAGNHFPLTIDLNSTAPYEACDLLNTSPYNDSNISWTICDTDLLEINTTTNKFQVVHPELITQQTSTMVKGTFTQGDVEQTGYFKVIILPQHKMISYEEACQLVKDALADVKAQSFNINSTLPLEKGDVQIAWSSLSPELLSIDATGTLTNNNTTGEMQQVTLKALFKLQNIEKKLCITMDVPSI